MIGAVFQLLSWNIKHFPSEDPILRIPLWEPLILALQPNEFIDQCLMNNRQIRKTRREFLARKTSFQLARQRMHSLPPTKSSHSQTPIQPSSSYNIQIIEYLRRMFANRWTVLSSSQINVAECAERFRVWANINLRRRRMFHPYCVDPQKQRRLIQTPLVDGYLRRLLGFR